MVSAGTGRGAGLHVEMAQGGGGGDGRSTQDACNRDSNAHPRDEVGSGGGGSLVCCLHYIVIRPLKRIPSETGQGGLRGDSRSAQQIDAWLLPPSSCRAPFIETQVLKCSKYRPDTPSLPFFRSRGFIPST